jgi:hypothetical protein
MAKSVEEYYNSMATGAGAITHFAEVFPEDHTYQTYLQSVHSQSKSDVDVLHHIFYVVACFAHGFEVMMELFMVKHQEELRINRYGSTEYLQNLPMIFQLGDVPTVVNGKPIYPILDVSKRIVNISSVTISGRTNLIKVASGTPPYTKLSQPHIDALQSFVDSVAPPVPCKIISGDPDQLIFTGQVFYYGWAGEDIARAKFDAAVLDYISNLPFNGVFNKNELIEVVTDLPEIYDFVLTDLFLDNGFEVKPVTMEIQPRFGRIRISDTTPLASIVFKAYD